MPLFKLPSVAEPAVRSSPVIVAVNNGIPGNLIQDTECQQQYNRLASIDGLNRCRPGIKNVVNTGANAVLAVKFLGNGIYLVTDGTKLRSRIILLGRNQLEHGIDADPKPAGEFPNLGKSTPCLRSNRHE